MKLIELKDSAQFNGKAGSLSKHYDVYNVAKGFIIPNEEFEKYLIQNSINLNDSSDIVRNQILNGNLIEEDLLDYYDKNKFNRVIVRSSASVEDGNMFSFAGQFDSFTNTSRDTLIQTIKKCWAMAVSENVKSYINKPKQDNTAIKFDILIQEMIDSKISGVAFSVNPVTGKKNILLEIANASCEEVVSGKVIPNQIEICEEKNYEYNGINLEKLILMVNDLKRLYKKDIEIEFGYKDGKFYLFQVRPITKVYFSLVDYINTEFWCSFKNNNWFLFDRTLWILGATKYKNNNINNEITEDITIYYPHGVIQKRGFNGNQPPVDKVTINKHSIEDITVYIDENQNIVRKIIKLSKIIESDILKDDYLNFGEHVKELIKLNAMINSYEYLIGSLGAALYETLDSVTLKSLEHWRNNIDNSYFPIYDKVFDYLIMHFNSALKINLLRGFIHVNELLFLINGKISIKEVEKRVIKREKNGFVLLNLRELKYSNRIMTSKKIINTVREKFNNIESNIKNDNVSNSVKGNSTFKNGKIITGKCVVLKDDQTLENYDLKDKIVVCKITNAKDVVYLKNVKALIVDNGGILCHSAIFSREMKIPCLMGCNVATETFSTGDILTFDVDKEVVYKSND